MSILSHLVHRPRLMGASALAVVAFFALLQAMPWTRAMLIAFDVGAALYLGLTSQVMLKATASSMRHRALLQEGGKWAVLGMGLCVACTVLGALSFELHAAKNKSLWDITLASGSILLSWLFVAEMFSQQYAHSFYLQPGQLVFPGTEQPDYMDFVYFALVLSMCCQTSDVMVTSGNMRRLVMLHSVLSFFFNVIIIAITVNVVAGVL